VLGDLILEFLAPSVNLDLDISRYLSLDLQLFFAHLIFSFYPVMPTWVSQEKNLKYFPIGFYSLYGFKVRHSGSKQNHSPQGGTFLKYAKPSASGLGGFEVSKTFDLSVGQLTLGTSHSEGNVSCGDKSIRYLRFCFRAI
jgi:hypothetical protein